jgi:hypothetical protein
LLANCLLNRPRRAWFYAVPNIATIRVVAEGLVLDHWRVVAEQRAPARVRCEFSRTLGGGDDLNRICSLAIFAAIALVVVTVMLAAHTATGASSARQRLPMS